MIESVQIAMTRFTGPGRSTVCRAKSSVLSTLFELNLSLPDTIPPTCDQMPFNSAAGKGFFFSPCCTVYRFYLVSHLQRRKFTRS